MSVGEADLFGQAEKIGKASVGARREHKGILHRHQLAQTRKGGQVRSGLIVSGDADLLCKRQLQEQFVERPDPAKPAVREQQSEDGGASRGGCRWLRPD